MKQMLEVHVEGSLLLGGTTVAGTNDATQRRADGLPYLPAAALKGAIRQQLVRLIPEKATAILGDAGADALADQSSAASSTERPGGGSTRVYFSDAELVNPRARERFKAGTGFAQRTQVSIDRRSRRSASERLFQREILAPFGGDLLFRAEVDTALLDKEEADILRAATDAVFALGGGRSSGLGKVRMSLVAHDEEQEKENIERPRMPDAPAIDLILEALDPVCLGAGRILGNFRPTLDHLPASTLRGALVTAALAGSEEAGVDQSEDPTFQQLILDPTSCLRFGDAWPIATTEARPVPSPFTLRTCKAHGPTHGVIDRLVRAYLHQLAVGQGSHLANSETCQHHGCGERLVAVSRPIAAAEPERRVVTRLGLDPRTARGSDGQLFSLEVLERGTRFVARVGGLNAAGRDFLGKALEPTLRVGHGRGQGYGRMRIVKVVPTVQEPLTDRLDRLNSTVSRLLHDLAKVVRTAPGTFAAEAHHLAITLTTQLVPSKPELRAEAAFLDALQLPDVEVVYSQVRSAQRGGWDARARRPKATVPVLLAGSVLLLRTPKPLKELAAQLSELEERGAGLAREEGLGWLRVSDPIHLPQWRTI